MEYTCLKSNPTLTTLLVGFISSFYYTNYYSFCFYLPDLSSLFVLEISICLNRMPGNRYLVIALNGGGDPKILIICVFQAFKSSVYVKTIHGQLRIRKQKIAISYSGTAVFLVNERIITANT